MDIDFTNIKKDDTVSKRANDILEYFAELANDENPNYARNFMYCLYDVIEQRETNEEVDEMESHFDKAFIEAGITFYIRNKKWKQHALDNMDNYIGHVIAHATIAKRQVAQEVEKLAQLFKDALHASLGELHTDKLDD